MSLLQGSKGWGKFETVGKSFTKCLQSSGSADDGIIFGLMNCEL